MLLRRKLAVDKRCLSFPSPFAALRILPPLLQLLHLSTFAAAAAPLPWPLPPAPSAVPLLLLRILFYLTAAAASSSSLLPLLHPPRQIRFAAALAFLPARSRHNLWLGRMPNKRPSSDDSNWCGNVETRNSRSSMFEQNLARSPFIIACILLFAATSRTSKGFGFDFWKNSSEQAYSLPSTCIGDSLKLQVRRSFSSSGLSNIRMSTLHTRHKPEHSPPYKWLTGRLVECLSKTSISKPSLSS